MLYSMQSNAPQVATRTCHTINDQQAAALDIFLLLSLTCAYNMSESRSISIHCPIPLDADGWETLY